MGFAVMAETMQVNVRVPEAARDAMIRLAARLREDPAFVEQLEVFLDAVAPAGLTLLERVALLEDRVRDIELASGLVSDDD